MPASNAIWILLNLRNLLSFNQDHPAFSTPMCTAIQASSTTSIATTSDTHVTRTGVWTTRCCWTPKTTWSPTIRTESWANWRVCSWTTWTVWRTRTRRTRTCSGSELAVWKRLVWNQIWYGTRSGMEPDLRILIRLPRAESARFSNDCLDSPEPNKKSQDSYGKWTEFLSLWSD